jgi:energy-coupling factor transport system ATP-binding protein
LFSASVADEVAFGLEGLGLPQPEIEARIQSALDLVGLAGLEQRAPRTLSGGQQKRLALASVLAMQPRLLVLDEPTSGLDPRGRHKVLAAIDRLRREGAHEMTVVMATQDAEATARFADRVLVLRKGQIALDGTPEQIFAQVERLDAWGIDVPQLARLGARLGHGAERRSFTGASIDPRLVGQALVETGFVDTTPAPVEASPTAFPDRGVPRIEVHALAHRYPGADEPALSGVDLKIRRGEWLAIVGINGSGKSTLIRHLNGLLKPTEGQVTVEGQDTRAARIGELARVVSYLPQNPGLLLFASTVRREIAYGPRQLGLRGAELEARVADTLDLVGLADYAEHPPAVLSYGLRRQVALASVLAMQTPVLALDEPATGLDRGAARHLLDLIAERQRQGTTVVMITHDLRWVARYAQRVAILSAGQLVACGPTRSLLADLGLLSEAGLDPLPVTALAHALDLSAPLPLTVDELLARAVAPTKPARDADV